MKWRVIYLFFIIVSLMVKMGRSVDKVKVVVVGCYYKYDDVRVVLDYVVVLCDGLMWSVNIYMLFFINNVGVVIKGCKMLIDVLEYVCECYKYVMGKKVCFDFNMLFDYVVVLSEV